MPRWLWTTWLAIPVLNTLQQLFLKLGASDAASSAVGSGWFGSLLASPWFAAAVVAEIICFVVWMTVLAELDLSLAFPLSAASYVLVMLMAWIVFGEPLKAKEIIGSLVILGGIWCLVTAAAADET
ncbi:EamA family transporter [Pleomorphomonas sp. PLEO]|uniref:EamA family transporter n=1 Tax=Pleomorphomonas sp. PLEO TaxID=3239306 RepID=UPI00351ED0E8